MLICDLVRKLTAHEHLSKTDRLDDLGLDLIWSVSSS